MKLKIVSITVTYNGEKWIEGCLDSLLQSKIEVSPIVIDNASQDGTVKIIREKYPEIYLIQNRQNSGFAQMNNLGMRYALSQGADYVLLLNQDARIDSRMLDSMLNASSKHPQFGLLSPLHLDYEGQRIDPLFFNHIQDNVQLISDAFLRKTGQIYEVPFVNAAVWLLGRGIMEAVGGFDPLFFMYGEDSDFCRRARFLGFKVGIVPVALAYHKHLALGRGNSSIMNESNWIYSGLVYEFKNPANSFLWNLTRGIFAFVIGLERKLIVGDIRGFIAAFVSILKIANKILHIRHHYNLCKVKGNHWLRS